MTKWKTLNFSINQNQNALFYEVQSEGMPPELDDLSDLEKENSLSAITLAFDRAHQNFLNVPIEKQKEPASQISHYFFIQTDTGTAWLLSMLFTEKMIHIQSPAFSSRFILGILQNPTDDERVGQTGSPRQIDHWSGVWENNKIVRSHLTSIRDASGEYCFKTSHKIYESDMLKEFPDRDQDHGFNDTDRPQQVFFLSATTDQLDELVSATQLRDIGSSKPHMRGSHRISTNFPHKSPEDLETLLQTCQTKLSNRLHFFDLRGSNKLLKGERLNINCLLSSLTDTDQIKQGLINLKSDPYSTFTDERSRRQQAKIELNILNCRLVPANIDLSLCINTEIEMQKFTNLNQPIPFFVSKNQENKPIFDLYVGQYPQE